MRIFNKKIKVSAPKDKRRVMPDGLWSKCPKCNQLIFNKILEENLKVCGKCQHHFTLTCWERVKFLVDENSFVEFFSQFEPQDPLNFKGPKLYKDKIKEEQRRRSEEHTSELQSH